VSGGHAGPDALHVHGHSPLHRAAPEAKVMGTLAFVGAVVVTPREAVWAFALQGLVALTAVLVAGLPPGLVARRMRVELPFVAFAVFLPLFGGDPRVDVLGLSLSGPGLWAAWNVLVKATLGVLAAVVLAATTPVSELLRGLHRLHLPRAIVEIAGFMVRYLGVITGEAQRMHVARQSRGYEPRWLWQARGVAASIGTLFVRSYERGERVHLAMASRGYTGGALPDLSGVARPGAAGDAHDGAGPSRGVMALALLPVAAWLVAGAALVAG
jgi:cobalt/nickel transport system permease protein